MLENNQPTQINTNSQTSMIFSIPIDKVTIESSISRIISMIQAYKKDKTPKQIVTVNVDFLVNALGWTLNGVNRHPELLNILRRADLVTADGMPIVWLSRLLKNSLPERVTGADLVPALAAELAKNNHSVYFLGGQGDIAQQAADILKIQNPQLNIAGVDSPYVYTDGEQMLRSENDDDKIIEAINAAKPDVLLMGFGNPKQELWFNRNRHKIKVPVSIGIGGTYEFIVGRVNRAPEFIQKAGLEWIYRIVQDPKRLWKRYAVGLSKILTLSTILLFTHLKYSLFSTLRNNEKKMIGIEHNPIEKIMSIYLSENVIINQLHDIRNTIFYDDLHDTKKLIIDFKLIKTIDNDSIQFLIELIQEIDEAEFRNKKITLVIVNLVNNDITQLLKANHCWDIFEEKIETKSDHDDDMLIAQQPINTGATNNSDIVKIQKQTESITYASLEGKLDAYYIHNVNLETVMTKFGARDCLLDIKRLTFIDSTGLRLLYKLQRYLKAYDKKLILINPTDTVQQLFNIMNLNVFFNLGKTELINRIIPNELSQIDHGERL